MRMGTKQLLPALMMAATTATALAGTSASAVAPVPERFTGNLVDTFDAGSNRPFILTVDRYSEVSEIARLNAVLAADGLYHLRDLVWKQTTGYLSVNGSIGYAVAAALSEETPGGRTLRVILVDSVGEGQSYSRASQYPFTVLELNLDRSGKGDGRLLDDARLRLQGDTVQVDYLGIVTTRLLNVRESYDEN
jgi:hypothetical protein